VISGEQTVFIVDDDDSVLKAISRLLGAAGYRVSAFNSAHKFLESYEPSARGCVLLDITMPGLNGIELQEALLAKDCALPIIFLTGCGDVPTSVRAMKHGAIDFLTKPVDDQALVRAVSQALKVEAVDREKQNEIAVLRERLSTLTPREHEVLAHVIAGRLNKQIAGSLGTTEKTVKVHRARVMEKMQANSIAELVRLSSRAGVNPVS